jgi:hypothetical protein
VNEVGRACGTHGTGEKCTIFWQESPRDREHSEHQGIDRTMGSEWILGRWLVGAEWIQLAQDRDRWRALVKAVELFGYSMYAKCVHEHNSKISK